MKRVISPPKGRYLFDGGLNTKFEKTIIDDNESPDCLNVVFSNRAVGTREGVLARNAGLTGSFVCDGLYTRHVNTGAQTMVAFMGGSAWTVEAATLATIPSAQSVFTAGIRVGACEYQNHLFCGNGGVIPYKYNGTDFTRHGVYPPTETSTVASQANGFVTGSVQWRVTYVNSQSVEGDLGPATVTFAAASATARVTSIPVAPQSFGISARRLYRRKDAGIYLLVTTLNDNTTTTYDDNIPDASLGATAPTDNGVPPMYSIAIYHRDRVFTNDSANPNQYWYSDLEEPYTFAATNFRVFGDNTQDIVRALAVNGENIAVFGDVSIEVLYMPSTDDTEWLRIKVKSDYGCRSPFGIVKYANGLLFPAIQAGKFVGFAHLVGDALAPSASFLTVATVGSDLLSNKIEPEIMDVANADVDEISGFVWQNMAYFAVASGDNPTENNRILLFDFSISNLSKKTPYSWAPWTGLYPAQFTESDGSVYYGDGRAVGVIRKMNSGFYRDDSTAINSYYWTKEFGGGDSDFNFHKDFRFANILIDMAGDYFMNFTARTDSDLGSGNTQTIDLDPGGSLWGSAEWGLDLWGGGVGQKEVRLDLGTLSGKRIQFKFDNQNTVNQRFRVHGLNFLSNVKGFR